MSLVAVYRLDEEGNVTRNGQLGTEDALPVTIGTTGSAAGLLGNGLIASGAAAAVSKTGGLQAALAALRSFSMAAWVKYTGTPGSGIARVILTGNGGVQQFPISFPSLAGSFSATIQNPSGNAASISSGTSPNSLGGVGVWSLITLTWDNATHTAKIYVNDVLKTTKVYTVAEDETLTGDLAFDSNWDSLTISARTNMIIDQLMIDDTVVDLATVQAWYNGGAGYDPTAEEESPPVSGLLLLGIG